MFRLVVFEPFLAEVGDVLACSADGRRALGTFDSGFNFAGAYGTVFGGRADSHRGGPARNHKAEHLLEVVVLVPAVAVSAKVVGTR